MFVKSQKIGKEAENAILYAHMYIKIINLQ